MNTLTKVIIALVVILVATIIVVIMVSYFQPRVLTGAMNTAVLLGTTRKPFYTTEEKKQMYPESMILENHWKEIRDEFLQVQDQLNGKLTPIVNIDPSQKSIANQDNWKAIVLKTFGKMVEENRKFFPKTFSLIEKSSKTLTCFFSIIEPRKGISPHNGYFGGVLRYHLGLIIPKEREECWIEVNGTKYSWSEGEGIVFDDLYTHQVMNNTDERRVVLFIDFERPLNPSLQKMNKFFIDFIGKSKRLKDAMKKSEIQQNIK